MIKDIVLLFLWSREMESILVFTDLVGIRIYVCTVNRPTSITRLGSFENVANICQFQFLDPPPHTHKQFFGGGGYTKVFRPPTH